MERGTVKDMPALQTGVSCDRGMKRSCPIKEVARICEHDVNKMGESLPKLPFCQLLQSKMSSTRSNRSSAASFNQPIRFFILRDLAFFTGGAFGFFANWRSGG